MNFYDRNKELIRTYIIYLHGIQDHGREFQTPEIPWSNLQPKKNKIKLIANKIVKNVTNLVTKSLESSLEFMPQFPLCLFSSKIIPVMHVLVLAQVCCDLTNLNNIWFVIVTVIKS